MSEKLRLSMLRVSDNEPTLSENCRRFSDDIRRLLTSQSEFAQVET